jgi:uncharacterized protein YyaL (SSP411 family)
MTAENILHLEKSPYLLSHAKNPVHWQPWGDAAFELARRENKPVFLSIGYFTCHWCHVMERESFEDAKVASLLNEHFVSVKVDREERPDVDQVYMLVCQAVTGSGGWPLTLFLTPDREPFFVSTYLPRQSGGGRPGLVELLQNAAKLWGENQDYLKASARQLSEGMASACEARAPGGTVLPPSLFEDTFLFLNGTFDPNFGGFGSSPKFPSPHQVSFLFRRWRNSGSERALAVARRTVDAWLSGGLRDHLGGGFHRYSTDKLWHTPHFEKMLYDQAGIALVLTDACLITGDERYKTALMETLGYLSRNLSSPQGGFYCGEDADSEGVEGLFYLWSKEEILKVLGETDGEFFSTAYGVTAEGNYREEATGEITGLNILDPGRLPSEENGKRLGECRKKLFAVREKRVRPNLDDKVLTGWSCFAGSAFARAGRALGDAGLVERAKKAFAFVEGTMERQGKLLRRYRDGEAAIEGFLEDYGFYAKLALDLCEATLERSHLEKAVKTADSLWELFSEPEGLYDSPASGEALLFRPREIADGAMVSGNTVAMEVAMRLYLLTGEGRWKERGEALAASVGGTLKDHPHAFTGFLNGLSLLLEHSRLATVRGRRGEEATENFIAALAGSYAPETAVLFEEEVKAAPGVQLCIESACLMPIDSVDALKAVLEQPF